MRLGGAERQLVGLAETLSTLGHDVEIVTYHPENFYGSFVADKGLKHIVLRGRGTRAVAEAVAALDVDLVISFLVGTNLKACLAKKLNKTMRLVVSERNCNTSFHFHDWVRFAIYYHFSDLVLCNNYSQEAFIRKHFPKLAPKLATVPNFVDLETFHPSGNVAREGGCHNRIVVAARVSRRKNTHGLIEAARILIESGLKDFVIDWYGVNGDGKYLAGCRKMIEKYNLKDNFHLLPATSKIAEVYRDADFFCLPSFYEGTSNALAEALASGLPVACGSVSDNVRYVLPWKNGFLFDPHDSVDMAYQLSLMLKLTPGMRRNMAVASRGMVEMGLSREAFAEGYKKIIATFAGSKND